MGRATLVSGLKLDANRSNLKSFLHSVTPSLEAYMVAKPSGYFGRATDLGRCFYLVDLWNHFYQWSACGVSTLVCLPSGEKIDQYFVPYLSAIQLYTNNDLTLHQNPTGRANKKMIIRNLENNCSWFNEANNWNDQSTSIYDSPRSKMSREPCFQYFECDTPYDRIPLADKVYELYYNFPPLSSLNSIELSPSSWMSVFWYPIGHVPMMNQKDLSTCFLTYHSLSTFEDCTSLDSKDALMLPPLGLTMHKMDEDVWISVDNGDKELAASLTRAAESWLKKLDVKHHDFEYFLNSNMNLIQYKSLPKAASNSGA